MSELKVKGGRRRPAQSRYTRRRPSEAYVPRERRGLGTKTAEHDSPVTRAW
jgi:hypothetical protein